MLFWDVGAIGYMTDGRRMFAAPQDSLHILVQLTLEETELLTMTITTLLHPYH